MVPNDLLELHDLFRRPLVLVQQKAVLQLLVFELETQFFVSLGRFFKFAHFIELVVLLQVFRRHLIAFGTVLVLCRGFLRSCSDAQWRLDASLQILEVKLIHLYF